MHTVDRDWDMMDHRTVPSGDGDTRDIDRASRTFVKGPVNWTNPDTGKVLKIWERHKTSRRKMQRFACHKNGIGRVTDYRKTRSWQTAQAIGRCKFPAGLGWQLDKRRACHATAITITKVELDDDNAFKAMTFKWFVKRGRSTELHFDHIYRYQRELGPSDAWAQDVVCHGESNFRRPGMGRRGGRRGGRRDY
ncbi:MAG: hypothetical protein ACKVJQ_02350 [Alphaproteobacteria bacterium]|jgi:hypothetical protein